MECSADGVGQSAITIFELRLEFLRTLESQQRMSEGVVSDDVSGFHQFANDVWTLLHVAPDQKKCGVNIVPRQYFQQAQSMRIVGTVIVSKRQLLRSAAQPGKCTAKPLPGRRHGLIAHGRTAAAAAAAVTDVAVHADRDCKCNAGKRIAD